MLLFGLLLVAFQQPRAPVAFGRFEGGLSGTVLDERGEPLEGARVEWRVRGEERSLLLAGGRSGADGRFDLDVERSGEQANFRDAFLVVEFPGLAPTRVEQLLAPDEDFELGPVHVYPFAELHGRVTTAGGAPIAGAQIHAAQGRVVAPNADTWSLEPLATTDANGEFACRNVPSGVVTLGVSAKGFADLVLEPRSLALRAPNELSVTLEPGRSATLHLRAPSTGAPIVAICTPIGRKWPQAVDLVVAGQTRLSFWRGPQTSDSSGRVTFEGLRPDAGGGVVVEADGCAPQIASLAERESQVTLLAARWLEITAHRARSTGEVELAKLSIRNDSPRPDPAGSVEDLGWRRVDPSSPCVDRVAPARWRVEWNSLSNPIHFSQPTRVEAFLSDGSFGEAEVEHDPLTGSMRAALEFEREARLVGRLVMPPGESALLGVRLHTRAGGPVRPLPLDSRGRFDVVVGPGPLGFHTTRRGWRITPSWLGDALAPGETRKLELLATREPELIAGSTSGGRRLRGRVTVAGAEPGRHLLLALGENRDTDFVFTHSDPTGRFEFDLAVPNTFRVTPLLPAPSDTSFREFRREIALRTIGSIRSLPRTSDEFDDVLLELPPIAEWPRAPRSER